MYIYFYVNSRNGHLSNQIFLLSGHADMRGSFNLLYNIDFLVRMLALARQKLQRHGQQRVSVQESFYCRYFIYIQFFRHLFFISSTMSTPSAKFRRSRASFWVSATRKLCTNFMSIASRMQPVAAASAVAFVATVVAVVVVEFWFSYAWIWNPTMQWAAAHDAVWQMDLQANRVNVWYEAAASSSSWARSGWVKGGALIENWMRRGCAVVKRSCLSLSLSDGCGGWLGPSSRSLCGLHSPPPRPSCRAWYAYDTSICRLTARHNRHTPRERQHSISIVRAGNPHTHTHVHTHTEGTYCRIYACQCHI